MHTCEARICNEGMQDEGDDDNSNNNYYVREKAW